MKVALVYDRVNKWGGAERLLLSLHTVFPKAPLYTSVYNQQKAPWAKKFMVKTSFLQYFPFAKSLHEFYALLMPLAFESFSFDAYDLVISVTSEAAKGIITKPQTRHVCYCLTPTRYLWSGYNDYFQNPLLKALGKPFIWYLRRWDKNASKRPDSYISISQEVQKRIKKYYDLESDVIYPPLTFGKWHMGEGKWKKNSLPYAIPRTPYFLIVSRLVPYKRIDIAIKACNKLQLPLVIIGKGAEEEKLRAIAGKTITFFHDLTEKELLGYYKRCRCLLFPGKEDFGLAMLEAQHLGKPVIAFRGGGALEIIKSGKTGEFFDKQTILSLTEKLNKFRPEKYKTKDCKRQAKKFTFEKFAKEWKQLLNKL